MIKTNKKIQMPVSGTRTAAAGSVTRAGVRTAPRTGAVPAPRVGTAPRVGNITAPRAGSVPRVGTGPTVGSGTAVPKVKMRAVPVTLPGDAGMPVIRPKKAKK